MSHSRCGCRANFMEFLGICANSMLTITNFMDAETYEELHNIHRGFDEERAPFCFAGWEHHPSSGRNSFSSTLDSS
jgi:hypothetical protein